MFPNRLGHQKKKKEITQQKTNKEKLRKKNGNNSTYHEPLSEEWIGRRF